MHGDPPHGHREDSPFQRDLQRALRDLGQPPADAGPSPPAEESTALDDPGKAMRFLEIQQRHMQAMLGILPGTASEAVIAELERVHQAYEELLRLGPPEYPLYNTADVQARIADVLHKLGQSHESLRDEDRALELYGRAATAFDAAGQPEQAAAIRDAVTRIENFRGSGFDAEIQRLEARLAELDQPGLERAEVLVQLGELYMRGGDDFAARERLESALAELERLGHGDPAEQDSAAILRDSMSRILDGSARAGSSEIETLVHVRGLHLRIYQCLEQIYQVYEDPADPERGLDEAAKYAAKRERLSRNELSLKDLLGVIERSGAIGADAQSLIDRIR